MSTNADPNPNAPTSPTENTCTPIDKPTEDATEPPAEELRDPLYARYWDLQRRCNAHLKDL